MFWYYKLLISLTAGITFRLGGSAFTLFGSEQITRLLIRAAPWAILLYICTGGPIWLLPAYTIGFFVGVSAGPWGLWTNLASVGDWIAMSLRGAALVLLPAYLINFHNYPLGFLMLFAGFSMSIAYWLGLKTPSTIPNLNQGREMGEFYTGLLIWAIFLLGT